MGVGMKLYKIRGWGIHFENNRSRSVKELDWISIPNRHDGENFAKVMDDPECGNIFSGFVLMLQVASKCNPRGVLVKDSGFPHDSNSLHLKTRAPKSLFDKAFEFLLMHTDWLECDDLPSDYQPPVRSSSAVCEEGKGIEGNRREDIGLPKEVAFWNSNCGALPKVVNLSEVRRKKLNRRRQDSFWVANFEASVRKITTSDFCNGKNDRGWKADFDWMLQDSVAEKIMEGKYDKRQPIQTQRPDRSIGTTNEGIGKQYRGIGRVDKSKII
jgi:hypothetical protein